MKANEKLEELGIEFDEIIQERRTTECAEAAKERRVNVSQIVKSLIIESGDEKFHILLPGDRELSERKFGDEYRLLPPEESEQMTGFESGTVHPFSTELEHVVDERVLENKRVSHTVGEEKRGVILDSVAFEDALKASDFKVQKRDIAVSTEEDLQEIEEYALNRDQAKFVVKRGYRNVFKKLCRGNPGEKVFELLKAFDREDVNIERYRAEEVLERAEDQSHMQRLAKKISENGELPEETNFNLCEKVSTVLDNNPEAVEDFKNGRESAINYLLGELMDETHGKANPGKAKQKIFDKIN